MTPQSAPSDSAIDPDSAQPGTASVSPLRAELARQIVSMAVDEHWADGTRLSDLALAKRLGVSRTPVRAALALLQAHGCVAAQHGQGYVLVNQDTLQARSERLPRSGVRSAYDTIRRDRALNKLPREVSETELFERYAYPRGTLRSALMQMVSEGIARKQRGHGWLFSETLDTRESLDQSLRYRMIVEPGALLQEGYACQEEEWQAQYAVHQKLLASDEIDRLEWLARNRSFHETLASWANNPHFLQSVQQQNHLRLFREQALAAKIPLAHIHRLCREHMAILQAIRDQDMRYASELLHHHLDSARRRSMKQYDDGRFD